MSITKLAFQNFKKSISTYMSIILSLAFTMMIVYNFQSLIYSDVIATLPGQREYIKIIVEVISVVLGVFLFFFIWYSTNVFLTKRKKEIGVYAFMGITNQKIGKMYALETSMIGLVSCGLGLASGIVFTQLFQMIILKISDIAVDVHFSVSRKAVLVSMAIFFVTYFIFVLKGYINIVRSSVLSMISANKQNEVVHWKNVTLIIKAVLGTGILFYGYYLAIADEGLKIMQNIFLAVVFVIIGVYLLFGGLLPLIFQGLLKNKYFLYKNDRTLWINSLVFRMKKNYRTYAITCILMLCSVTALGASFGMKMRYDNIVHFRNTYSVQFLSDRDDINKEIEQVIQTKNDIEYTTALDILVLDSSCYDVKYDGYKMSLLKFSQVAECAKSIGATLPVDELNENELLEAGHIYLMSFDSVNSHPVYEINGNEYTQVARTEAPLLGYLQESQTYLVVNDKVFDELLAYGEHVISYNYEFKDIYNVESSRDDMTNLVLSEQANEHYAGCALTDPYSMDINWIRVFYSLCIFVFLVFIVSSGCILLMRLYNDAFEERDRYAVLSKLGYTQKTLKTSITKELFCAYSMPFFVMMVSAIFSMHCMEKVMSCNLQQVYILCVFVVLAFFFMFYVLTCKMYIKVICSK